MEKKLRKIMVKIVHAEQTMFLSCFSYGSPFVCSDRMIRVWSLDGVSDAYHESTLKVKAFVAAHDKDINSLAVAPNDSLLCSGSEVSKPSYIAL